MSTWKEDKKERKKYYDNEVQGWKRGTGKEKYKPDSGTGVH